MCVIDRVPVRTDCLSTSETTADGMEEHGCIDAAHNVKRDIVSLELGDFGKKIQLQPIFRWDGVHREAAPRGKV